MSPSLSVLLRGNHCCLITGCLPEVFHTNVQAQNIYKTALCLYIKSHHILFNCMIFHCTGYGIFNYSLNRAAVYACKGLHLPGHVTKCGIGEDAFQTLYLGLFFFFLIYTISQDELTTALITDETTKMFTGFSYYKQYCNCYPCTSFHTCAE